MEFQCGAVQRRSVGAGGQWGPGGSGGRGAVGGHTDRCLSAFVCCRSLSALLPYCGGSDARRMRGCTLPSPVRARTELAGRDLLGGPPTRLSLPKDSCPPPAASSSHPAGPQ
jgi:hypothetical protein